LRKIDEIMNDFFISEKTIAILSYLLRNPGVTVNAINADFLKRDDLRITTATIYRKINELERNRLIARLPIDKTRLILTLKAEKMLEKQGFDVKNRLKIKRCKKLSFQDIIQDLGSFYEFGSAVSHEKFTIFPVFLKELKELPILGLIEGEKKELAWIQESEDSESVQQLEAINKSKFSVLIPYLHQVEGGKQDRTVFEPILVPVGYDEKNPLTIPARCIEQSRWTYSSSRGQATSTKFKSAKTRMASQMANVSAKAGDQATVWNAVGVVSEALGFGAAEAPTSSYREVQEKAYEKDKDLSDLFTKFSSKLKDSKQVGIVCAFGDRILGLEIFGSPQLWNQFREVVLKGFLADRVFMQKVETGDNLKEDISDLLYKEFKDVNVSKERATGEGLLFRFNKEKWEGINIQLNGIPVHFYATKEHVDILKGRKAYPIQREAVQTFQESLNIDREIMGRAAPEQIIQEQRER
jgi:DNA-binding MarR family transcriptional regulator